MKLVKASVGLLMALSMGAAVAAEGDTGSVSTDTSNPNTYGGSQDVPAYQIPNNDSGIELKSNSASADINADSGSANAPSDLNEATHSFGASDQGANSADTGSAGSGYSSGFEGSK